MSVLLIDDLALDDLRTSVVLEREADIRAMAFDLRGACEAMRRANAYRRSVFGNIPDPNELRQRTHEALHEAKP